MKYLKTEEVIEIQKSVIEQDELQGLAPDKSLDAVLGRIFNRANYGMISDVYHFSACYAAYIAVGHCFNDANKRTGFACMDTILALNGIDLAYDTQEAGQFIIKIVLGERTEDDLASWLRALDLQQSKE